MRDDLIIMGLGMSTAGFAALWLAALDLFPSWANLPGGLLVIAGGVYFLAGLATTMSPPVVSSVAQSPSTPAAEPKQGLVGGAGQDGSQRYCSWCWTPIPKGADTCTGCGKKIS